jgi:short-subunit dehydrogenase
VVPVDLADATQVDQLVARVDALPDLGFLVNAAGFVTAGAFATVPDDLHRSMLRVHVEAPLRLCRAAVPGMLAREPGAIVTVASIGGLVPSGGNVTYSGTKAFLVAFTQALDDELRATGVRFQALCPGFTRTGIYERDDLRPLHIAGQVPGWLWMSAEQVVEASLRALANNQVVCVPGWQNRLLVLGGRFGLAPLLSAFAMRVTGVDHAVSAARASAHGWIGPGRSIHPGQPSAARIVSHADPL